MKICKNLRIFIYCLKIRKLIYFLDFTIMKISIFFFYYHYYVTSSFLQNSYFFPDSNLLDGVPSSEMSSSGTLYSSSSLSLSDNYFFILILLFSSSTSSSWSANLFLLLFSPGIDELIAFLIANFLKSVFTSLLFLIVSYLLESEGLSDPESWTKLENLDFSFLFTTPFKLFLGVPKSELPNLSIVSVFPVNNWWELVFKAKEPTCS